MNINLPTVLTLLRIAVIPLIVICYFLPFRGAHLTATTLFVLAALTDWLDGYLARSLSQSTRLGAFLDPVADKLLVAVTLVVLVSQVQVALLFIPAAIIVCREIVISALREWMAELGKRTQVAVNQIAKIKTAFQMTAVAILLGFTQGMYPLLLWLGIVLLYVAALLTVWTMLIYLKAAWPDLTLSREG